MSIRSFRSLVNAYSEPKERREWVAYRFRQREFKQRKHGSTVYDTVVRYVEADYWTPDTYDTL